MLIHIGYHKTGTSWLQRHLFPNPELGFSDICPDQQDIHARLVHPHALDFDAVATAGFFEPRVQEARERGLVPVLSCERLCGNLFGGGFDSKELADRLAAVFPGAKILIVFREQRSMILSSYKQYVRAGGLCDLGLFLQPPEGSIGSRSRPFDFDHYKYHRLIDCYGKLFGAENVLALPYELFRTQPEEYAGRILSFAGARPQEGAVRKLPFAEKENESLTAAAIAVKRRFNTLVRDELNPWASLAVKKRTVLGCARLLARLVPSPLLGRLEHSCRQTIASVVGDRYRESNRRTVQMTGMPLDQFGYDVA